MPPKTSPSRKSGKKKPSPKNDLAAIERAAKRNAQKEQGALDGRFRTKKVESKKRYKRKSERKVDPNELID
jgi:hypothetical protein